MITKIFKSSSEDHSQHNGIVTVLRELNESEADISEVGRMFNCLSAVGEFDAFEDELSDCT
jgi:hypothetical protein